MGRLSRGTSSFHAILQSGKPPEFQSVSLSNYFSRQCYLMGNIPIMYLKDITHKESRMKKELVILALLIAGAALVAPQAYARTRHKIKNPDQYETVSRRPFYACFNGETKIAGRVTAQGVVIGASFKPLAEGIQAERERLLKREAGLVRLISKLNKRAQYHKARRELILQTKVRARLAELDALERICI